MQRISEWRNGISKYAVEVVNDHFRAEEMTETEISRFVTTQLGRGLPFVSLQTSFDPVSGIAVSLSILYSQTHLNYQNRSVRDDSKDPSYFAPFRITSSGLANWLESSGIHPMVPWGWPLSL